MAVQAGSHLQSLGYELDPQITDQGITAILVQWNLVNTFTSGPQKFGRINGVSVLTG